MLSADASHNWKVVDEAGSSASADREEWRGHLTPFPHIFISFLCQIRLTRTSMQKKNIFYEALSKIYGCDASTVWSDF